MPTAPQEFTDRLHTAFDGRLRVRWSNAKNEYQIEQNVARGMMNFPAPLTDDEAIRLKDGYFHVMSVRNGDRMPCPKCNRDLPVPIREVREVACTCGTKSAAGFFPLDDTLITYLQAIDPMRGMSREMRNKINAHNDAIAEKMRQGVLNQTTDAAGDDFARIAGIPSVGFTGKILPGSSGAGTK